MEEQLATSVHPNPSPEVRTGGRGSGWGVEVRGGKEDTMEGGRDRRREQGERGVRLLERISVRLSRGLFKVCLLVKNMARIRKVPNIVAKKG